MAEFAYKNVKIASIGYTLFKLNCKFYLRVFFKKNIGFDLKSCFTNKQAKKLRELIKVYCQNLFYAWKLQKKTYDKRIKSHSYISDKKI